MNTLLWFVAGGVAVPLFHQIVLGMLYWFGVASRPPFSMAPTAPFGVPQLASLMFWGALWGIVLGLVVEKSRYVRNKWLLATSFGALAPSFVAWFIVAPLKELPLAAGGLLAGIVTALLINGAWGLGTLALYRLFTHYTPGAPFSCSATE